MVRKLDEFRRDLWERRGSRGTLRFVEVGEESLVAEKHGWRAQSWGKQNRKDIPTPTSWDVVWNPGKTMG